jgi:ATP-dependent DNA helicase RecG
MRNARAAEEAIERLKVFEATRDGFEVADRDLHLRGPGEFLGTRQSGLPRFRFGNILRDHDLMEQARDAAIEIVEKEGVVAAEETARRMLGVAVDVIRD